MFQYPHKPHRSSDFFKSCHDYTNMMPIHYLSGDLFVNRYNAQAFAHGCNCKGAMGAGIAKGFRERYPDMYQEYRQRCKTNPRQFNPGDSLLWEEHDKPLVFNLATQEDYQHNRATCEAIERSLKTMKEQADEKGINTIAMARIGAGYGGLSWNKVRPIIERAFQDWPGIVYVYEKYAPGE
jgi:O-acetyl-ADP-ribose deacetylase (regulator of RNase III)